MKFKVITVLVFSVSFFSIWGMNSKIRMKKVNVEKIFPKNKIRVITSNQAIFSKNPSKSISMRRHLANPSFFKRSFSQQNNIWNKIKDVWKEDQNITDKKKTEEFGYFQNKLSQPESTLPSKHIFVEQQPEDDPYYGNKLVDVLRKKEATFGDLSKLYHSDTSLFSKEYANARFNELVEARKEAAKPEEKTTSQEVPIEEQEYAAEVWFKGMFDPNYMYPEYSYHQIRHASEVIDNTIQHAEKLHEEGRNFINLKLADGTLLPVNYTLLDYIAYLKVRDKKSDPLFEAPEQERKYMPSNHGAFSKDNHIRLRNFVLGANIKELSTQALPKTYDKKLEVELFETLKSVLDKDIIDQKTNRIETPWNAGTLRQDLNDYKDIIENYRWSETKDNFDNIRNALLNSNDKSPTGYFIHNTNGSVKRSIFAKAYLAILYARLFAREKKYLDPQFLNFQRLLEELQTNEKLFDKLLKKMNVAKPFGIFSFFQSKEPSTKSEVENTSSSLPSQEPLINNDKNDPHYDTSFHDIFKEMSYSEKLKKYEELLDAYGPTTSQYSALYCATRLKDLNAAFGKPFYISGKGIEGGSIADWLLECDSAKMLVTTYKHLKEIHMPYAKFPSKDDSHKIFVDLSKLNDTYNYSAQFLKMLASTYQQLMIYDESDWVDRAKDSPFLLERDKTKYTDEEMKKTFETDRKIAGVIVKDYNENADSNIELHMKDGSPILLSRPLLAQVKRIYGNTEGRVNKYIHVFVTNLKRLEEQQVPKAYYDKPEDKDREAMRMIRLIREIAKRRGANDEEDKAYWTERRLEYDFRTYKEVIKNYQWADWNGEPDDDLVDDATKEGGTLYGFFHLIDKDKESRKMPLRTRNIFAVLYLVSLEQTLKGKHGDFLKVLSFLNAMETDKKLLEKVTKFALPVEGEPKREELIQDIVFS